MGEESGYDFNWEAANADHLARHDVSCDEFEQTFKHPRVEEQVTAKGESRVWALGHTDAGRYLTLVYTVRGNNIRAVTAHTTKRKHRRVYDEAIRAEDPKV